MRVIAGSARRIQLETPEGSSTRPTQDRIKETLFNMLGTSCPGSLFVDLFAGSGQMGIEALSRGAAGCLFLEQDPIAASCILRNLEKTKLSALAQLEKQDVFSYLENAIYSKNPRNWDLIFMDPPYGNGLCDRTLSLLCTLPLKKDCLIICETAQSEELILPNRAAASERADPASPDSGCALTVERVKDYKTNRHTFFRVL